MDPTPLVLETNYSSAEQNLLPTPYTYTGTAGILQNNQAFRKSTNQSTNQSINQTIYQLISLSIKELPIKQFINISI